VELEVFNRNVLRDDSLGSCSVDALELKPAGGGARMAVAGFHAQGALARSVRVGDVRARRGGTGGEGERRRRKRRRRRGEKMEEAQSSLADGQAQAVRTHHMGSSKEGQ